MEENNLVVGIITSLYDGNDSESPLLKHRLF